MIKDNDKEMMIMKPSVWMGMRFMLDLVFHLITLPHKVDISVKQGSTISRKGKLPLQRSCFCPKFTWHYVST